MAYFAGYGFNKSHSAAYALIAYQTAYLKANYTAEFMACLISLESHDAEKMSFYLQEAKDLGITIVPPDINKSEINFTVVNNKIIFGLQGIKNVGLAALESIIAQRKQKPFKDLLDICMRLDLRTANKRVLENLVCAGAFDLLPGNRAQKFEELHRIMETSIERKKALLTGQMDLFGLSSPSPDSGEFDGWAFSARPEWNDKEKLEREKEVVGFYLSAHPLEAYRPQLKRLPVITFLQALAKNETAQGTEVTVICCGLLKSRKDIMTKKQERMSFLQYEDMTGIAEVIAFPKLFSKIEASLQDNQVFVIKGGLDVTSTQKCKIKANEIVPLETILRDWPSIEYISITLPPTFDEALIANIKALALKGNAQLDILFTEQGKQLRLRAKEKIAITPELISALENEQVEVKIAL